MPVRGFTKEEHEEHSGHHYGSMGLDYSIVSDVIWLGTNACCTVGFSAELLAKDVMADISLEDERVDNPKGVDYFLWLPVEDHMPPTSHQLRLGVQTIQYFVENNIKLYAHCKNGHGRAPTLIIAYFVSTGMTSDEAYEFVREKRPSIHLEDSQMEAIRTFTASLK